MSAKRQTNFMNSNSISHRQKIGHLLKLINKLSHERAKPFIYHLYEEYGYTYQQIANLLHVTRQSIQQTYPKGGDLSEKQDQQV